MRKRKVRKQKTGDEDLLRVSTTNGGGEK